MVRAPGRVNLLGAHVDYQEGFVLPAAIDRSVWLAASRNGSSCWRLAAVDLESADEVDLGALRDPVPERSGSGGDWIDLPEGIAWVLADAGFELPGLDVVFGGDLPIGAGVSSSAAVEVAFLLAWRELSGADVDRRRLARFGREVENRYLGVGSGIMDQLASLLGRRDHALLLDCRSLETEALPLPTDVAVLVVDSGVRRRLVGSGFDDRRSEAEAAADLLRPHLPGMRTLRDVEPADLDRLEGELPPLLRRRARHVVEECRRVLDGADALRRGDLEELGRAMLASHRSSRDLCETSISELDVLVESVRGAPGCFGARLAGGGFGGCVLTLVERSAAAEVERRMADRFGERFGRRPEGFVAGIADGAEVAFV